MTARAAAAPAIERAAEPRRPIDRVIVVGGGLAGVSVLYELASRGVSAVLLEAREGVAEGTSFANGGMLTASMSDPWNSPGVWRHLASSVFDPKSAFKLRIEAAPGLAFWGLRFLVNSAPARHTRTTMANFRLASYSVAVTEELRTKFALRYDASATGTMKVFDSEAAIEGPLALAESLRQLGMRFEKLDRRETLAREPQLEGAKAKIAGALYFPDDQSGDARLFTLELAKRAVAAGGEIRTGVRVDRLLRAGDRVRGVEANGERIEGEVVLAAGVDAPALARQAGVPLPIKPVKGCSVTLDAEGLGNAMPRVPVVDDAAHAAVVPLGARLRLVGTAEFAGRDLTIRRSQVDNLFGLLDRLYPELAGRIDRDTAKIWTGLRPMSSDGAPIIGPTTAPGLWVNGGHGHLGWTMASGSARLLADLMQGRSTAIDPTPYASRR